MPKFSPLSLSRLTTAHPDLQTLFHEVVKSFDCTILEGHRGQAAQDKAYAMGNTQLKYPKGRHNSFPSLAVDVVPYPLPDWKNASDFAYFAGYVMCMAEILLIQGKMTHKIRWGGDWSRNERVSDERFIDMPHFELLENKNDGK